MKGFKLIKACKLQIKINYINKPISYVPCHYVTKKLISFFFLSHQPFRVCLVREFWREGKERFLI